MTESLTFPSNTSDLSRRDELPTITLVMPSFNQASFLEAAIRSVLDQGYPHLEFIVCDGGSTDASVEIIKRYESKLTSWVSQPDGGQSAAIASGFARARGELLGWLNSDDILLPGSLMAVAQTHLENPSASLFGGNLLLINSNDQIIRCRRPPSRPHWFAQHGLVTVNQPGTFFTKDAYVRTGGLAPELRYVMDTDLFLRMLHGNRGYVHLHRYMAAFRMHSLAKSQAQRKSADAEYEEACGSRWRELISVGVLHRHKTLVFRSWQAVSGNYFLMIWDTLKQRGHSYRTPSGFTE
jgi:glycosyltransferase involved in cell wall biosynthesis